MFYGFQTSMKTPCCPWLLLMALASEFGYAAYLRSTRPELYEGLNEDLEWVDV